MITGAYFGQDYFLANQQSFNFWLADATGVAAETPVAPVDPVCSPTPPANWAADYAWRDTGAILHQYTMRDCAGGGLFTTEPDSLGTVLHETGHSPFGLADEYAGDGGYFENSPFPNLYDTLAECQDDAPSLGRVAADCQTITNTVPDPDVDWFKPDPIPDDLMDSRRPPNASDIRRIDWYFDQCRAENC